MLATGIGLLVALLGWGNQIKDFQVETKRVELLFAHRAGSRYNDVKKITDNLDQQNVKEGFGELLASLKNIIDKKKKSSKANFSTLNKIDILHNKYNLIRTLYQKKYNHTLELAIISFLTGVFSLFFENVPLGVQYTNTVPYYISIIFFIWVWRLILILRKINLKEENYQKMVADIDGVLEE